MTDTVTATPATVAHSKNTTVVADSIDSSGGKTTIAVSDVHLEGEDDDTEPVEPRVQ